MHEENFVDFINEILVYRNFRSFGTLVFLHAKFRPPSASRKYWEEIWETTDPDRQNWTKTPSTEWECLEQWLADTRVQNCLWLEECRPDEVRFHVLIDDPDGFDGSNRYWWREISRGWAFERQLDDRIGRLIGHMVMRAGYPITLRCGRFSGHYTQESFRPWKVKSY